MSVVEDLDPFYDPDADDAWKVGAGEHELCHKKRGGRQAGRGAALHAPAERWAKENFPGCAFGKLEGYRYAGGRYVKSDFEGFADFHISCLDRRHIFIQVTTIGDVGKHLSKYRTGKWGTNGLPIKDYIRKWLLAGDEFVILGMEKRSGRWVAVETWVTSDMLESKRKEQKK
jgi:hypothetical protein